MVMAAKFHKDFLPGVFKEEKVENIIFTDTIYIYMQLNSSMLQACAGQGNSPQEHTVLQV